MTSVGKIRANRANALASTGPRSLLGKSRAAQNARRHGLSASLYADPSTAVEVKSLASEIVGDNATLEIQQLALRIAEAQMELKRIRWARHDLINHYLCDPDYNTRKMRRETIGFFMGYAKGAALMAPVPDNVLQVLYAEPPRTQKLTGILREFVKQLAAMDRYERRALSRRKFAIRDLSEAGHSEAPSKRRRNKK